MKRWHRRTLIVLALGALGTVALGLRPALTPNEVSVISRAGNAVPLPEHLHGRNFSFTHVIKPGQPHKGTWFAGNSAEALSRLQATDWRVTVSCKEGKLVVETAPVEMSASMAQVRGELFTGISYVSKVRRPNGRTHTEYQLDISCYAEITPCFWQEKQRVHWLQFITIDVDDEAADMGTPLLVEIPQSFTEKFTLSSEGPEPALPARYCYSPAENALLRLLHTIAACTEHTHSLLTHRLISGSRQLARFAGSAPWPKNWGKAQDMAQTIAYRVGPTLEYLAENDCFGNQQLADYINGEDFAAIFGENFRHAKNSESEFNIQEIEIKQSTTNFEK